MRLGDAGRAVRCCCASFDAWEGNGRTTTFPEMLVCWVHGTMTRLANNGWICPPVLTSHLVLTRLSNVGGTCGRHRQARAPASLYLHRHGAADHALRGGVRFSHA